MPLVPLPQPRANVQMVEGFRAVSVGKEPYLVGQTVASTVSAFNRRRLRRVTRDGGGSIDGSQTAAENATLMTVDENMRRCLVRSAVPANGFHPAPGTMSVQACPQPSNPSDASRQGRGRTLALRKCQPSVPRKLMLPRLAILGAGRATARTGRASLTPKKSGTPDDAGREPQSMSDELCRSLASPPSPQATASRPGRNSWVQA